MVNKIVKNLPSVWETRVQSLAQEDTPEKGMATHSSILAWETPWTEEPGGVSKSNECNEVFGKSNECIILLFISMAISLT